MSLAKTNYEPEPVNLVGGSRKTSAVYPATESSVYGGNSGQRNQTRFNLSSSNFVDNTSVQVNGKLKIAFDGHTYTAPPAVADGILLPQSVLAFVDRMEMRIGGRLFDNILDYAVADGIQQTLTQSTDSVRSLGAISQIQTLYDFDRVLKLGNGAMVDSTYNNVWFSFDLNLVALFSSKDYTPMRYASSFQPVQLTIYWKDASLCMTKLPGDNTGATDWVPSSNFRYEISDLFMNFDEIAIAEASLVWDDRIMMQRLVQPVQTWTSYSTTLLENQTRFQHTFQHPGSDVRAVYIAFTSDSVRASASQTAPICISDLLWFPKGLQRASMQIGTTRYPANKEYEFEWKQGTVGTDISNTGPMNFRQMLMSVGHAGNHQVGLLYDGMSDYAENKYPNTTGAVGYGGVTGTINQNIRTSFFLAYNLDSNPNADAPDRVGTGVNTLSPAPTTMLLDLQFSEARGAYVRDTNPMGGSMTVHIFVLTRESYLYGANDAIRESKLVRAADLS